MANAYKYEVISVGMLVQLSSATEADTATRPAVYKKLRIGAICCNHLGCSSVVVEES